MLLLIRSTPMISINSYFRPSGGKFYSATQLMSDNIRQMSELLVQFCYEDNLPPQKSLLEEIEQLERKNDELVRSLIVYLEKTLTPPFDREDIHLLITTLDDIADNIYYIAKQRIIYGIKKIPDATKNITEKLRTAAKMLCEIITGLHNKNEILKLSVFNREMNLLLTECDEMTDEALGSFFATSDHDIIETVKFTDHFTYLQTLITKYMDTVEVINSMIIKYS